MQSGYTASLCVKVGVRTIWTLSFGDKEIPAGDSVVRLETSSNWVMTGFSETCCKKFFSSVEFREVFYLQRNPMLPILKSVKIRSFPKEKETVKPAKAREVFWPVSCEPQGVFEEWWL